MYTIEELFLPRHHENVKTWFNGTGKHPSPDNLAQTPKYMLTELGVAVYSMVGAQYNEETDEYELPLKTELALYGMDQPCTP